MEEIRLLKEKLAAGRPAEWDEFPDIALYMDQVVSYLKTHNDYLDGSESGITPAMINNYIKSGLLPRAQGKKYGKDHLTYLFEISLLKNSLSVRDMKLILQDQAGSEQDFYGEFLRIVDEVLQTTADSVDLEITEEGLSSQALQFGVMACACKLVCERMLDILRSKRPEAEKGSRKEIKAGAKAEIQKL